MIVRAALAALACLAARAAGQTKQCDLTDENGDAIDLTFPEHVLDDNDARGARSVLLADLNGDGDVDVAAAMSDPNAAMFRWYRSKYGSPGNLTFRAATHNRRQAEEQPAPELVVRLVEAHHAALEAGHFPARVRRVAHRVAPHVALEQGVPPLLDDLEHEVPLAADLADNSAVAEEHPARDVLDGRRQ